MEELNNNLIYDALWDDEVFNSLPQIIANSLDARSCLFHFLSKSNGHFAMAHTGQWNEEAAVLYSEHYSTKDDILKKMAMPENKNKFHNAMPELISEYDFLNSEIYKDFYEVIGDDMRNAMGICIDTPSGTGVIGIHRGMNSKSFTKDQANFMQSFVEDFKKMMVLRGRLGVLTYKSESMQSMLDNLKFPTFLVNSSGKIETYNFASETFFSKNQLLKNNFGYLSFFNENSDLYSNALAKATDSRNPQAEVFLALSKDNIKYEISVLPVPNLYGLRRAQIIIKQMNTDDKSASKFKNIYNFTKSESEIVEALIAGKSPSQIAEERQTTRGTIKSQLKSIFNKTNCNKQTQLIALVMSQND